MRQQMHEWCEREQYRAEDAMEQKNDNTLFNALRMIIGFPLFWLAGSIGGPLLRRIIIDSVLEAASSSNGLRK